MTDVIRIDCVPFSKNLKPEHIVGHIAKRPGTIWLDSASATHPDSRYSIIGWNPRHWLEWRPEGCFLDQQPLSARDPFQPLQELLSRYQSWLPETHHTLPFRGGVLCAMSYDLGRTVERLPEYSAHDILLPDLAAGLYLTALVFDHQQQQWFLLSPERQWQAHCEEVLLWQHAPITGSSPFSLLADWQANVTREQYIERFNAIQDYLLAGDCYQINLTQRFSAPYQGDLLNAYLRLRQTNGAPFSAYVQLSQGTLLSLSPERFISVEQRHVMTKPIKGTRPRSDDPQQDERNRDELATAEKDRAENLMIVDLLRNDVGKAAAPGSVTVTSLFAIESFPAVHHLVSTVEAELAEGHSSLSLLKGAFPGGSITGAPKVRAMEIIEQLEPHRRSFYCGSIGYLGLDGAMDTNIAIRTLIGCDGMVHCWGGGGIVADSVATEEYQESLDKVSRILPELRP